MISSEWIHQTNNIDIKVILDQVENHINPPQAYFTILETRKQGISDTDQYRRYYGHYNMNIEEAMKNFLIRYNTLKSIWG